MELCYRYSSHSYKHNVVQKKKNKENQINILSSHDITVSEGTNYSSGKDKTIFVLLKKKIVFLWRQNQT